MKWTFFRSTWYYSSHPPTPLFSAFPKKVLSDFHFPQVELYRFSMGHIGSGVHFIYEVFETKSRGRALLSCHRGSLKTESMTVFSILPWSFVKHRLLRETHNCSRHEKVEWSNLRERINSVALATFVVVFFFNTLFLWMLLQIWEFHMQVEWRIIGSWGITL